MPNEPSPIKPNGLTFSTQEHTRKREWNRAPLTDLFPRIPAPALETVLDICISKNFTYNLSESRHWNARRYTSIVIAHVRHNYSEYDRLLREERVERFAARERTRGEVWKVLRDWCPWDTSNEVLERCFLATLLRPEERDAEWGDPMDIDSDEDFLYARVNDVYERLDDQHKRKDDMYERLDDPMDLD